MKYQIASILNIIVNSEHIVSFEFSAITIDILCMCDRDAYTSCGAYWWKSQNKLLTCMLFLFTSYMSQLSVEKAMASNATATMADIVASDNVTAEHGILFLCFVFCVVFLFFWFVFPLYWNLFLQLNKWILWFCHAIFLSSVEYWIHTAHTGYTLDLSIIQCNACVYVCYDSSRVLCLFVIIICLCLFEISLFHHFITYFNASAHEHIILSMISCKRELKNREEKKKLKIK